MEQEFHCRRQDFMSLLDKSRGGRSFDVIALRFQEFFVQTVSSHRDEEMHDCFKRKLSLAGKIGFRVVDIGCRCG
ncbi:hypothetical protein D3C72_1876540 [compost metagenome]